MIHSHQTAPTQFVEANSIRFAYRRFGKTGGVPEAESLDRRFTAVEKDQRAIHIKWRKESNG